jgi:hypothetical protein
MRDSAVANGTYMQKGGTSFLLQMLRKSSFVIGVQLKNKTPSHIFGYAADLFKSTPLPLMLPLFQPASCFKQPSRRDPCFSLRL